MNENGITPQLREPSIAFFSQFVGDFSVSTQGSLLAFGRSYGPGGLGVEVGAPRGSAVYLFVFYEVFCLER